MFRRSRSPPVAGFSRINADTRMIDLMVSYNLVFPHVELSNWCQPGA